MLALDYVNYARWFPVILANLKLLLKNKSLFQEFSKDNFTVKKSDRVFSNMGFDQAHELTNKIVKAGGGRIGIFDSEAALVEWAVSGPQISDLLQEIFSKDEENDFNFDKYCVSGNCK